MSAEPQRGGNDIKALTHIVQRIAKLNGEIKEANFEIKELADSAWEKCGKSAKAVKQLAKESAWDAVKRKAQQDLEEEVDAGRLALGMLSDTPLGEAAIDGIKNGAGDADEPQHHATDPKYKSGAKGKKGKKAEQPAAH